MTRGHAKSLACYVINSVVAVDDDVIEAYGIGEMVREFLTAEKLKRRTTIIAPGGAILAGPLESAEGILYTNADLDLVIKMKYSLDYAGHYNRPELFAHHFKRYFPKEIP
jgi:nitrilase